MATALEDSDLARCPICLDKCNEAKKMPKCDHSFCKACIITYVTQLVNTGESEPGIPCPFCQVISCGPKDKEEINIWINSLEHDENIVAKLDSGTTGKGKDDACNSCSVFGISSKASQFCFDCLEVFCIPCSVGRHSIKAYRTHKITEMRDGDVDNEKVLDSFQLLKEYMSCDSHPEEKIKFHCKENGCLCCAKCVIVHHRKCDDVVELQDSATDNDAKQEMEKTKRSVGKLISFAKNILDARKGNLDTNKQQTEAITRTLKELRTKMNKLFDALEETSTDQAKAVNKKMSMIVVKEMEDLHAAINGLAACLSLIEKAMKFVSGRYLYAILQKLMKRVNQYETTVLDIWDYFQTVKPELKIHSMLQEVLDVEPNDTSKVGTVIANSKKVKIPYFKESDLLRNYTVTKTVQKTINENDKDKGLPAYSDLMFLPNNNVVFVDQFTGFVCLTNKSYEVISHVRPCEANKKDTSENLSTCTYTRDGKVAVCIPGQSTIYILTANRQLEIAHKIITTHKPRAVYGLETGDLAVAWEEPVAFGIISDAETPAEKVFFCEDKAGRKLSSFQYISVDEIRKHVIQPCQENQHDYCFSFEGYPKFRYANNSLNNPKGVALDRDGNIYVCSCSNPGSLHILSPTGLGIRIIKNGCPYFPLAIKFKKNGEEFAVTQQFCNRVVCFFSLNKQQ